MSSLDFCAHAMDAIDEAKLPIFDAVDVQNDAPGKRQPSLRESLTATTRRFDTLDELKNVFGGSVSSIVYGGSMKYGPFMNVRAGYDSSDIDLLITTNDDRMNENEWAGLKETSLIDDCDKLAFFERLKSQGDLYDAGKIDIMSQRFSVKGDDYTLSAHFVPKGYIGEAYPGDLADVGYDKDHHKYVRDYKERPFERTHVTNSDMSGRQHEIPVYNTATSGGFIVSNPAYSIIGSRYIPGMYQNLVLPNAKYVFDNDGASTLQLGNFTDMVADIEVREQHAFDRRSSVDNTEPRKSIMPIDASDILYL